MAPMNPRGKSYDDLTQVLRAHYEQEPVVIAERYHFYRRISSAFVAELRKLEHGTLNPRFVGSCPTSNVCAPSRISGLESDTVSARTLFGRRLVLQEHGESSVRSRATGVPGFD